MIIRVNVFFSPGALHLNRESYLNPKERNANGGLPIVMHKLKRMGRASRHISNQTTWVATFFNYDQVYRTSPQ